MTSPFCTMLSNHSTLPIRPVYILNLMNFVAANRYLTEVKKIPYRSQNKRKYDPRKQLQRHFRAVRCVAIMMFTNLDTETLGYTEQLQITAFLRTNTKANNVESERVQAYFGCMSQSILRKESIGTVPLKNELHSSINEFNSGSEITRSLKNAAVKPRLNANINACSGY